MNFVSVAADDGRVFGVDEHGHVWQLIWGPPGKNGDHMATGWWRVPMTQMVLDADGEYVDLETFEVKRRGVK